ncbi:MAG: hypothetical protein GEV10_17590 [Streptosporangiales bacterium]|nr:hypothetical protein [Streptosporangiales bacterium]
MEVGDRKDVRSGGIVAGNFAVAKDLFANPGHDVDRYGLKVYWVPLHAKKMPGLTVRLTRLTGKKITRTMRQNEPASSGNAWFYPSGVPIREAGTWQLEAAGGPDRGCFIATFRRAG